jgi:PadR family transcriptional regulator PadR
MTRKSHPKMPAAASKNAPDMSPTERVSAALPKNFVRPALLLLLLEQPAHGYELVERLRPFGIDRADPGGLYRNLHALEDAGLVYSAWQESTTGPDRHIYHITHAGREELHAHAKALAATNQTLQVFLSRYLEFVNFTTDPATTG